MSGIRRAVLTVVALICAVATVGPNAAPAQAEPRELIVESGYFLVDADHGEVTPKDELPAATTIPTSDSFDPRAHAGKLRLRYTLVRPAGEKKVPVLFEYSGYDPGSNPDASYIRQFVQTAAHPYAYLGVSLRGTGCSEGQFDFFQPAEAYDAEQVIHWIIEQDWARRQVGMLGKSYPGITQLFVAAQRPNGLRAIAPGHVFADAYRDIGAPGGIPNKGFASLWSFVGQPSYEFQSSPPLTAGGEVGCARGSVAVPRDLATNPMTQLLTNPFDNELYAERSPLTYLQDIRTPMWTVESWQDEQLGSRQTHFFGALDDLNAQRRAEGDDVVPWWGVFSNGDHGTYRSGPLLADLQGFLDHFVAGIDNGWEDTPHVRIWWEAADRDALADPYTDPLGWLEDEAGRGGYYGSSTRHTDLPRWVASLDSWSLADRLASGELSATTLPLSPGVIGEEAADGTLPTVFTATPAIGSQGLGNPRYGEPTLPDVYVWNASPAPGTYAAYTTPPLADDLVLLGPAALDLTILTTNPDVDLQVTLTEVRDGQERFVQQGWLRASHRAELPDDTRPTGVQALLPVQTHTFEDFAPIVPGQPTRMRIEVFPFGHAFRAGSQLRVWVETPTVVPQLWSFLTIPAPAPVAIVYDTEHAPTITLPVTTLGIPAAAATTPDCGTVIRQPCRPDPLA